MIESPTPLVVAREVTRTYASKLGASTTVLSDCSVSIEAATVVAILGKSGSGKSTLLNLLSGVDQPTSGYVELLGKRTDEVSDREMASMRASSIGFVLQRDNLVHWLSIEENVAAPLIFGGMKSRAALKLAREMLDRVGLAHRAGAWPGAVSGGEAQRAAVARACVTRPVVVFADEPTGALDRGNRETVQVLLTQLVKEQGAACVLVTHDDDFAQQADVVWSMEDGTVKTSSGRGAPR